MHKKLISACFALVALAAVAAPSVAQAINHPVFTHPTGTKLAIGTKFTATNIGSALTQETEPGTGTYLSCSTATMTGELTRNETGNVQGQILSATYTGTGSGSSCTGSVTVAILPMALPWCLKSDETMENDEFQISGGKCSEAAKAIKFAWKLGVGGECEYESTTTIAFRGTYTTDGTGDAVLSIPRTGHTATADAGFKKIRDTSTFQLCPSSLAFKTSFTLETDEATAKPLYISE